MVEYTWTGQTGLDTMAHHHTARDTTRDKDQESRCWSSIKIQWAATQIQSEAGDQRGDISQNIYFYFKPHLSQSWPSSFTLLLLFFFSLHYVDKQHNKKGNFSFKALLLLQYFLVNEKIKRHKLQHSFFRDIFLASSDATDNQLIQPNCWPFNRHFLCNF